MTPNNVLDNIGRIGSNFFFFNKKSPVNGDQCTP